jgi:Lrp/AsnC family transcriptional regulator, leucine-responsive regulatory protein
MEGLDETDRRILLALSRDGRRAAADLAKELGLSRQAVTDRIRGLEQRKVIRGYRADVDPAALGLTVRAQIRLVVDGRVPRQREALVLRRLEENPLVRLVHRVSGEDCFVVSVIARRIEDVTALLTDIQSTLTLQATRTAFVLETVLDKPGLGPIDPALLALDGGPRAGENAGPRARPRRGPRRS